MSDRITEVRAPGRGSALQQYGRLSRSEAIAGFRRFYEAQRDKAERALAVPDEELRVVTFLGPWAQRNLEEVREL